ncbi:MAG: 4'-phosphopantetheinyl transferase superfamily protein [Spirochaetaceae bacterium]|jgi:4'-phosphopantetheinyl transferase|nr:4'-phosphopantetheinyl transferase superfamily protein [Spirochaetaceae bacterium]
MQVLFYLDIRILASQADRLAEQITPSRREQTARLRGEQDRLRSLAAGLFLAHLAAGQEVLYGERGKPYLSGGPHFNLSHSGDFICCAVSDSPVGVDLEFRRGKARNFTMMARRAFHPEEQAFFFRHPGEKTFLDIWTLKESRIKMTGTGFSTPPASFSALPDDAALSGPLLPGTWEKIIAGQHCSFRRWDALPGYSLAACSAAPDPWEIHEFNEILAANLTP